MTFLDLARRRRSIRAYRSDPVANDLVAQVLEGARIAPSACNRQPWYFIVMRDQSRREALKEAYPRAWLWSAPLVIVACIDTTACWTRRQDEKNHGDIDAAIAFDHLTLAACDLGLGTCWVCAFDPIALRRLLALPSHIEPVAMTPLGFPAETGKPMERKSLMEIVRYDIWE